MYLIQEWLSFWISFLVSYYSARSPNDGFGFQQADGTVTRDGSYCLMVDGRPLNTGDARAG